MKIDDQILPYLETNARDVMSVNSFVGASIKKLTGGDYNYNYRVSLGGRDFLVRVNIEPQSGLDTQIEYEYHTLEHLAPYHVAPQPMHLDNSRVHLPYGLLIEEYISGKHLEFSVPAIKRAAEAMAALHQIPVSDAPLRRAEDPFKSQVDTVAGMLESYKQRLKPSSQIVTLGEELLAGFRKRLPELSGLYEARSIVHTDPNPANLIDTGERVVFIDWEQGRIDDPSYDVAAFFSDVLNLWASPRVLTQEEKQAFLEVYQSKANDESIEARIAPRLAVYTLTAVIWAAGRIADVDEGKIDAHLGTQNYERYKAMSDITVLENVAAF